MFGAGQSNTAPTRHPSAAPEQLGNQEGSPTHPDSLDRSVHTSCQFQMFTLTLPNCMLIQRQNSSEKTKAQRCRNNNDALGKNAQVDL